MSTVGSSLIMQVREDAGLKVMGSMPVQLKCEPRNKSLRATNDGFR